ncbi:hypothetical protein [Pedobacter rhodius]|uniref:SH3 domain-containing protein n=1 Tax=Pedobacter rhodius TaxID=3004098 RepID=A0ABT4KSG3_9SPHI|nr:hypothetical protein [Pedobacter sp. SJ11]MCZ4221871.1 hypothetical protein [Pedobacter sp. SJ11]
MISVFTMTIKAQNGTYEKKNPNGAYCYISFQKSGNLVSAQVFSWWNTANNQMGYYNGTGTLKSNSCVLVSTENEPGCKVTLTVTEGKIKAAFGNCTTDHLPTDFNGLYSKITDAVAGDYIVNVPKAYFYKKADAATKLKTYVLKGDKVTLDIENVTAGNWALVYFTTTSGKDIRGFIPLSSLKKSK